MKKDLEKSKVYISLMNKIPTIIHLLLWIGIYNPCLSQEETDTGFWDKVESAYRDSVAEVIVLTDDFIQSMNEQPDSSRYIKAIKYQGRAHRKMGNYVQAIDAFSKVYTYASTHKDSLLYAEAADQISTMNIFMGNMAEGQKYLLEVVDVYSKVGTKKDIAHANNGLAIFYNDIGQIDKAIDAYKLSLSQSEEIDDTMGRANVHANLGMLYLDQGNYELAEYHILKQGQLDTLMRSQWGLGFYHDFMGSLKKKQGRYAEALRWKKSSLAIRENLPSHYNIAETRSGLASLYNLTGNYDLAIFNAHKILDFKEEHQSLSQQMSAYNLLAEAYEGKKDFRAAVEYQKKFKEMSDSIYNRDMLDEIAMKDALYEKEKKDKEIAILKIEKAQSEDRIQYKNKVILICVIGLIVILGLILMLFRLFRKVSSHKDKLSQTLKDKDVLLGEIHHRVKNNLQLISSILSLQGRSLDSERAQEAIMDGKSRVRSMALIHQDLYNKKNLRGVGVKEYLEKLTKELFATYNTKGDKIQLEMDINDCELDVDTMIPLGLIINELVTNSLKYAFPEGDSGTISVRLNHVGSIFHLEIADNGIGFDPSKVKSNTFGTTMIRALSHQLNSDISINTENGTSTEISFSVLKKAI